jgi:integrase
MKAKISPAVIARARPRAKPYEIRDVTVPGLLLRVQPSGVKAFYVTWARNRRRVIGRAGLHTVEAMRTKAKKILIDAEEHGEPAVAESRRAPDLGTFIREHYKPWAETGGLKHAKGELKALHTEFGSWFNRPLHAISVLDHERYRRKKVAAGVKQQTVNRHFDRLHLVLSKAVEWKYLAAHPWKGRKRAKVDDDRRVRWLKPDEEERLRKALAARDARMRRERESANRWREARGYPLFPPIGEDGFGDHLTPMVLLSINTGLRRGELRQIAWADVDLERASLRIRAGYAKSRRERHLPLNDEALDALERWKRQSVERPVVFGVARVDKAWSAVLRRARIVDFRWHDLRHHFASRLVMAGVDLNTVRELLGHADIQMTIRYSHLAPEHKAAAVARLVA